MQNEKTRRAREKELGKECLKDSEREKQRWHLVIFCMLIWNIKLFILVPPIKHYRVCTLKDTLCFNCQSKVLHFSFPCAWLDAPWVSIWLGWKFCGIAANYLATKILKGFQFQFRFQSISSQLVRIHIRIEIVTGLSHPQMPTHWQIYVIYLYVYVEQLSLVDSLPGWTIAGLMWMLLLLNSNREREREWDRVITASKQTTSTNKLFTFVYRFDCDFDLQLLQLIAAALLSVEHVCVCVCEHRENGRRPHVIHSITTVRTPRVYPFLLFT